jgi:WD40 repeat protein
VGHTDEVTSIAFSPDGKTLASASGNFDGTIILWDVATRQPLGQPLTGHTTGIEKVVFSPDGKTLASASDGSDADTATIFLWDVATRQRIGQPLTGHTSYIRDLAFSPDGKAVASGSWDNTILVWEIDLESWIAHACRIANRNLTRAEWEGYFGKQPYHKTCPNLP